MKNINGRLKGKKLKDFTLARRLTVDPSIDKYLADHSLADSYSHYESNFSEGNGYVLLPYKNGIWTEDKLVFNNMNTLTEFASIVGLKLIKED